MHYFCKIAAIYQWNHTMYERHILVFQRFHVSNYPCLGMIAIEDRMLQIWNSTMEI